jgi:transcriptional regulator with GAF, ATPase, and Fis domain
MAAVTTPSALRSQRILVASGDSLFRRQAVENSRFPDQVREEAKGGADALFRLTQSVYDGVLLDRNLPDLDAGEVAEIIRKRHPQVEVQLVDSQGTWRQTATQGMERADAAAMQRESASATDGRECNAKRPVEPRFEALPEMIGSSRAIQQVYRLVHMVSKRDTTVLITGETGTGKELVANAIHRLSSRAGQPFVAVNCAAIPEALLEAELFGHARGAFTGAVQSRLGRIHVAQGGTLFLDEIGELPLGMQAKLLRFLQNGEVQRLGSSDVYKVDVRVVCATNVRLFELVQAKQFRMDLYYRMAVFPIMLPPLRERRDDIATLAKHFLAATLKEASLPEKYISEQALALLEQSNWIGNVRELQHAIERACILATTEDELREEHFPQLTEDAQMIEL